MLSDIMYRWRIFPIRVHAWGGLGSQLHAWLLFELLKIRFPRRTIQIVFHSSGVTRRVPELSKYFDDSDTITLDDFSIDRAESEIARSRHYSLRKLVKDLLQITGFFAYSNDSKAFSKIKPWVLEIRGHYSRLEIGLNELEIMRKRAISKNLPFFPLAESSFDYIGVQLRLGDLLEIASKKPIAQEILAPVLGVEIAQNPNSTVYVFSDSPNEVSSYLGDELAKKCDFSRANDSAWSTIDALVQSKVFVGSTSKLSTWINIYRSLYLPNLRNYMPSMMKEIIENQNPNIHKSKNQNYF